ncbi:MAG: DNA polymerase III subunit alpha [Planctomycetes bacterium]|nr:DNA polymerase III subunit alpha [Planctomycetota bacterium]
MSDSPDFAHLHVHSEYSLLDGANRLDDLVAAAKADGQRALALTDHGNLFGGLEFYQKARKAGIKPIIGCEIYIARDSHKKPHHKTQNPYNHLTLLVRDRTGYQNLLKLATTAYLEGFHYRPRIDKETLARHAAGLSCLSGCLSGEISDLVQAGKMPQAERTAVELRDLFGKEHFWLELQRNGIEIQARLNEALVDISARTGIPLVATNDIHYLRAEDCHTQDVLLCINTGAKRADEKRFRMDTQTLFFRTGAEMAHEFRDLPQTLPATLDVAEQVALELEFGTYHLPVFTPDEGGSPETLFDRLCAQGLVVRYGSGNARAEERLEYEKRVIRQMGFVSYFLIVWDLIRWAREHAIPVGPGRGSAAGSIVAYVLDITRVDPLRYDLLFERFLNSARISMPDIDIDFCKEGRERVLEYTRARYGAERVSQIGTFATLSARSVIRDVGRTLDLPLSEIDKLAKMVPQGPNAPSLAEAVEDDAELAAERKLERYKDLFDFSIKLDGLARHISTHAAGVVIADRPIVEYVPLCTNKQDVVTQWPAKQLEDLGLLKMDYLGLRTLTILQMALRLIERSGVKPPDLDRLALDDKRTYALLNRGETLGVFQLESEGMRKLLARLKPDCFEDLIACLALYRPGPLESGMADMFIRRKHGQEKIDYPHASLEPLLRDTYGCIVYQEQVMLISNALGNFSLNEADNLRKAMGKKQPEIMNKYSAQFVAGAVKNGCAEQAAKETWEGIVKFGGYGFNKSHSTAYALITWQTAFLKAHHRIEFLAANMSCEMQSSDKIKEFLDDSRKSGIRVLPPDIQRSRWEFVPEDGAIRFGFGAIKGTGEKAIEGVSAARERLRQRQASPGLHALCAEADPALVTKLTWEALIKAGSFDAGGHNRGAVLAALELAMAEGVRTANDRKAGQASLFGGADESESAAGAAIDGARAFSRAETLKAEYEVLGFYLSGHPLEDRAGLFALLSSTNTRDLQALPGGTELTLAGLIVAFKESMTKAGKRMARFRLEDMQGGVNVTCFPRTYEKFKSLLVEDSVVICRGKLEERTGEEASGTIGMLLDEILQLEDALKQFKGGLIIRLQPADDEKLVQLSSLVGTHRGANRLYFEVEGGDGRLRRVRSSERHNVRISTELAKGIEGLLGAGRTKLARI